jgi:hypothetical protein
MIEEHSKLFGFSNAHRWAGSACPGSVALCADIPDEDTEDSQEGHAAHYVLERMLQMFRQRIDCDGVPTGLALIGQAAPNGIIITEEMFDAAKVAYDMVLSVVPCEQKQYLYIEFRVKALSIDEEAWGTLDIAFLDSRANTLYVWDFKYGRLSVSAFENRQLIGYAQAFCETVGIDQLNPRLNLNIIQPRCYDGQGPLRKWLTTLDDMRPLVNDLRDGVGQHRCGTAKCKTGPQCYQCKGRYVCDTNLMGAMVGIEVSGTSTPREISDLALGYEINVVESAIDLLSQRLDALNAEAGARIMRSKMIPGRRMRDTFSRSSKWNIPNEQVKMLGRMSGVDFMKPEEPLTPTQCKTLLKKKGIDDTVIDAYHAKTKTGVKLVKDDNSRTREIFSRGIT